MRNYWLCFSFTILLAGCSPIRLTPQDTYTLVSQQTSNAGIGKSNQTLLVTDPVASSGFNSDSMVYVMTPYQLQDFSRNNWAAPPAHLLLPILVDAARSQQYFKSVLSAPFVDSTNWRLDTQLLVLQQEFLLPQSQVRMVIEAVVSNNAGNQIIASQRFSIVVPAQSNTPYGGVIAANSAANQLSQQIARFCVQAVRRAS